YHYEVFLYRGAEVRENAGTVNSGPVLFVTFNSSLPPVIEADIHTGEPSNESELYVEAAETRQRVQAEAPEVDAVLTPDPGAARERPRPVVRHTAKEQQFDEREGIITAIGDVYVSQGATNSADF